MAAINNSFTSDSFTVSYINMLDEIYKKEAVTGIFGSNPLSVKFSKEVPNTVYIKEIETAGLAKYDRTTGFVEGPVTPTWAPYTVGVERGRMFRLDSLDERESLTTILEYAANFQRNKVIPEMDAFRNAKIAGYCPSIVGETITADTALKSIDTAIAKLNDAEVSDQKVIFVSYEMLNLLKQNVEFGIRSLQQNNGVIDRRIANIDGIPVIAVPASRFYTECVLSDTDGYTNAGKKINFMVVDMNSIIPIVKYEKPVVVKPEIMAATGFDAYAFTYRVFHDLLVTKNKKPGIYVSSYE